MQSPDHMPPEALNAELQRPSAEFLLWAYRHTLFPMNDPDTQAIEWFSPDPRGILPLDEGSNGFHVPASLEREVRKQRFKFTSDKAFEQVMRECATDRGPFNRTWINEHFISVYGELHRHGHAHSIEAWLDGALVGGLYGVHIGAAFFGESMFSRPERGGTNASKIALVHLVRWLRTRGFSVLDTQFWNEHLDQFGCVEISAREYESMLNDAINREVTWGDFTAT